LATIKEKAVVHKLFDELKDRFMDRQGGYVRIVKKENRKGDGALISIIQLLLQEEGKKKGKKKGKTAAVSTGKADAKKKKEAKSKGKSQPAEKPGTVKPESAAKEAHESMVSAEIQSCKEPPWRILHKEVFFTTEAHPPSPFSVTA
jgi:large subunit ribosomal protein L17